jgi:hypothetical protein
MQENFSFSWNEGYDGEYEYTVTVHDNYIHWHLEFDEQWRDPPRDGNQSFEDFLEKSNPADFSSRMNESITEAVKKSMSLPGYHPYIAPQVVPDATPTAPDGPMKTSWEMMDGNCKNYVDINDREVVIGSTYGSGHTDNAVSCSHKKFLKGFYHDHITQYFGKGTLREIIGYVMKAADHKPFKEKRQKTNLRKKFIRDIPVVPSIKKMVDDPETIDGFMYYGNAGGYSTELKTSSYHFFADSSNQYDVRGSITHNISGEIYRFSIRGNCESVVELNGIFFIASWDNFSAVDSRGKYLYDTYDLKDKNGEKIFGEELRVGRTLRYKKTILVKCWWVAVDEPGSYLRFDAGKKSFTGRWSVKR